MNKLWNKFDRSMQNWYMSMSYPRREIVMCGISMVIGFVLTVGVTICIV